MGKGWNDDSRLAFVTVGATASFNALIRACLSIQFLQKLKKHGFTTLNLQYGKDGHTVLTELVPLTTDGTNERFCEGIKILGYDFKPEGLYSDLRAAKGDGSEGYDRKGVVISHAGSGTILDCLRIGVPLIVVPNPTLLDRHQDELAEELSRQGYVVHGKLDALPAALDRSEATSGQDLPWPPVNHRQSDKRSGGRATTLSKVMDEEAGFMVLD